MSGDGNAPINSYLREKGPQQENYRGFHPSGEYARFHGPRMSARYPEFPVVDQDPSFTAVLSNANVEDYFRIAKWTTVGWLAGWWTGRSDMRWATGTAGRLRAACTLATYAMFIGAAGSYHESWARLTGRKSNKAEVIELIERDRDQFVANNPDLSLRQSFLGALAGGVLPGTTAMQQRPFAALSTKEEPR
ncbi:unnamed protein product [Pedinophyceae sp. YPF-701]|nr:unnamed protein product [Pedinophyceae sp. YPF-701]